ncbi:MAG: preprotein translocase subunit SecE [Pseudomonadota bacterium]
MARTNPLEFFQEVRQEVAKVTWPTRQETTVTTIMVLIMTVIASLFFLAVDQVLSWVIQLILGFGGSALF